MSGNPSIARNIVSVSPFRCRVWELHDRLDDYITEESCANEIQSFEAHGQLVPALGRPLYADPDHDIEIVYGARRLFVARHLRAPLQVELRVMSDREALLAMDMENRHRKDTSPYERGLMYQRCLRAGLFSSQDELARTLNISPSRVSRLLKLTQLPAVVMNAFESPLELREGWGLNLYNAWQDERARQLIAERARTLAQQTPRVNALEAYRRLLAPAGAGIRSKARHRDEVVRDHGGAALFRIRRRRSAVAFLMPASISPNMLDKARNLLSSVMSSSEAAAPGADTKSGNTDS
jgi:ParB family chromosome partitioning protein